VHELATLVIDGLLRALSDHEVAQLTQRLVLMVDDGCSIGAAPPLGRG